MATMNGAMAQPANSAPQALTLTAADLPGQVTEDWVQAQTDLITTTSRNGGGAKALPLALKFWGDLKVQLGERHRFTLIALQTLVVVESDMAQYDAAIRHGEDCLAAMREVNGPTHDDTLGMLGQLGATYGMAGQSAKSLELLELAFRSVSDRLDKPDDLVLGIMDDYAAILSRMGRIAEATGINRRAFDARVKLHGLAHFDTVFSAANLASSLIVVGRMEEADALTDRVWSQVVREPKAPVGGPMLLLLNNRATALQWLGRTDESFALLERVVADVDRVHGPVHPYTFTSKSNLAQLRVLRGEPEGLSQLKALKFECSNSLGDRHPACVSVQLKWGNALATLKQFESARQAYTESLAIQRQTLPPFSHGVMATQFLVATQLIAQRRFEEALKVLDELVAHVEKGRDMLAVMGAYDQRQWQSLYVNAYLERVVALTALGRHGQALEASELIKARALVEQHGFNLASLSAALSAEDLTRLQTARSGLAEIEAKFSQVRPGAAADAQLSDLRQRHEVAAGQVHDLVAGLAHRNAKFAQLVRPRASSAQTERALAGNEVFVSFHLMDGEQVLAIVKQPTGEVRSLSLGPVVNLADAVHATRTLAGANGVREGLDGSGVVHWVDTAGRPHWRVSTGVACSAQQMAWTDRRAQANARVVESGYLTTRYAYPPGELGPACTPPGALPVDPRTALRGLLGHLSRALLSALAPHIGAYQRITISPDNVLWALPWDLLALPGEQGLLSDRHDVTLTHSFGTLRLLRSKALPAMPHSDQLAKAGPTLFAIGDPAYAQSDQAGANQGALNLRRDRPRGQRLRAAQRGVTPGAVTWPRLPYTKVEIDQASALFGANRSRQITGAAATETTLRHLAQRDVLRNYSHLLFSMHGYFDSDLPGTSGLVLRGTGHAVEDDGYFTVGDIASLRLQSQLAVVSACSSGLGVSALAEGLMGMSYALQLAGNRDAVVTLWPVPDADAAAFVTRFMTRIHRRQPAPAALAATKREFMQSGLARWRKASLWAAFVLHGG